MKTTIFLITFACFAGSALAVDAPALYEKNCASCHGKDGKGKTKAGRIAGAKDLTDEAYMKGFTDEQLFEGTKKGRKNDKGKELMKPFEGKLTDEEIKAVISFVRTFKK